MKLSFIIPVYNIENYIGECLDSILSQDFDDYEIICINDGSSDNSLSVLKKYESDKVIIIDKNNEGSGVARNIGIERAKGEYIWFVDGDDKIEPNCLSNLIKKADELDVDTLIFGGLSCYENKKRFGGYSTNKLQKKYFNKIFSCNDIKKDIFKFPSTAWTKLYRRDYLLKNNIKFQNIKTGQDQLFFFHTMITAEKFAIYPQNIYCYRKNRPGSEMTVKKKKNFSPIYVFYAIEELLQNTGKMKDYEQKFINRYFSKATSWINKYHDDLKPEYYSEYTKLLNHIKTTYKGWWINFNPSLTDGYKTLKLKIFFAKLNYRVKHSSC